MPTVVLARPHFTRNFNNHRQDVILHPFLILMVYSFQGT